MIVLMGKYPSLRICYLSTRSHLSKEENRGKNDVDGPFSVDGPNTCRRAFQLRIASRMI